jgi:hypothetical protein
MASKLGPLSKNIYIYLFLPKLSLKVRMISFNVIYYLEHV